MFQDVALGEHDGRKDAARPAEGDREADARDHQRERCEVEFWPWARACDVDDVRDPGCDESDVGEGGPRMPVFQAGGKEEHRCGDHTERGERGGDCEVAPNPCGSSARDEYGDEHRRWQTHDADILDLGRQDLSGECRREVFRGPT